MLAVVALLGLRVEIRGFVVGDSLGRVDAHGVPSSRCLGYLCIFET